jgi:predicted  nucleic acid-binding Zn-ribbon protein
MSHEPIRALEVPAEREDAEARLIALERAYEDLLQRVRRYERERAEIRARVERILARIGTIGRASP